MTVGTSLLLASALFGAVAAAGPAAAQSFARIRRRPASGARPGLAAPSIYSNRTRPAYAPPYRRPSRVCTIRKVREWNGDRFIERRYERCRDRW